MDYLFRGAMVFLLLCVLWVPTEIALRRIKHLDKPTRTKQTAILFSLELGIAAVLILIADRIGLLNPAGYVLAVTFFVSGAGVVAALCWPRTR